MLTEEPHIIERPAQPYVAIKAQVTMQTIGTVLPGVHPRLFAWLGERDIPPAGWSPPPGRPSRPGMAVMSAHSATSFRHKGKPNDAPMAVKA